MNQQQQQGDSSSEQGYGNGTQQRIQARAYELYSGRGQEQGHELDDWLQAEREVLELARRPPAHAMPIFS